MDLLVNRSYYTGKSTSGMLFIKDVFECFTLEPFWTEASIKPRAIPAGRYQLTIRWSSKFKKAVPHVESVPGFTNIEIHIGNFPYDTDGCTLVGQKQGSDFIGSSTPAWINLMAKLYPISVLTNPTSPEQMHVWNVGSITYIDNRGT